MKNEKKDQIWLAGGICHSSGRKTQRLKKSVRLNYRKALDQLEKKFTKGTPPILPKGNLSSCPDCSGSGLVAAVSHRVPNKENSPYVAFIGAGIGAVAVAIVGIHREIPFTLYGRDDVLKLKNTNEKEISYYFDISAYKGNVF